MRSIGAALISALYHGQARAVTARSLPINGRTIQRRSHRVRSTSRARCARRDRVARHQQHGTLDRGGKPFRFTLLIPTGQCGARSGHDPAEALRGIGITWKSPRWKMPCSSIGMHGKLRGGVLLNGHMNQIPIVLRCSFLAKSTGRAERRSYASSDADRCLEQAASRSTSTPRVLV